MAISFTIYISYIIMTLEYCRIVCVLLALAAHSLAACVGYKDVANLPYVSNSYCCTCCFNLVSLVKWSVSDTTLAQYQALDAQAFANYTTLYTQFYRNSFVDIDCLGMAKYFFCAASFPICT